MHTRSLRHAVAVPAAAVLLAVAGCSFQGSLSDASPGSSSPHTSPTTADGGTPTGASGTPTPGDTTSASAAPAGDSGSGTPGDGGSVAGQPGRCHTGGLIARLEPGSPGAGQRYTELVLTNAGGQTCTVYGYGGLGLVDAADAPLPTQQVRDNPPAPGLVTLRPQQAARSQLHWSAVPGTGDAQNGPCQPTPAALQVIPPDETAPLSVPWDQGPVCERGTIHQQAYTGR